MVTLRHLSIATLLFISRLGTAHSFVSAPRDDVLFRRQLGDSSEDCRPCPVTTCPVCPSGTKCVFKARECNKCGSADCQPLNNQSSNGSGGGLSPANKGAIAGATLGGFALAGLAGFMAYRTCVRKRKSRESMTATAAEKENDFGMLKSARASTHTVASIASTVRTRASNIIQIAYIPGVTNRSAPSTPAHHVPPVPPLPFAESPIGSQFSRGGPGDIQFGADELLRNSVYTTADNRSSVATTIYGGGAVVAQPNVVRAAGKAAVVQVKGGSSVASSSVATSPSVPAVPPLFANKNGAATKDGVPLSPAFSIGSTFFNRMNSTSQKSECESVTADRPTKRKVPGRAETIDENHSTYTCDSDMIGTEAVGRRGGKRDSRCSSCITDMETGSPFSDANSVVDALPFPPNSGMPPPGNSRRLSMNLAGDKRTSAIAPPTLGTDRTVSPFDDSHSIDKDKGEKR